MIRVNSGIYKGRKILEPSKETTRPSKDIVKVGLFNILRNDIKNSIFLDLFAGSGQIGIEALSLGSKKVYFIEKDKSVFKVLSSNLSYCDKNTFELILSDYKIYLESIKNNLKFNIIFVDPPYKMEINLDFIKNLIDNYLLDNGVLIFEREDYFDEEIISLYNFKEYKYGRSKLFVYRKI